MKLVDDTCYSYSESPDANLALCSDYTTNVKEGLIGMPSVLAMFQQPLPPSTIFNAIVHPEGDQLTATSYVEATQTSTIEVFRRVDTAWEHVTSGQSVGGAVMGIPSRGPSARILVHSPNSLPAPEIVELVQQSNASWLVETRSSPDAFGAIRPVSSMMNLSPDGRRVVFKRPDGTIGYAFRDSVTEPFGEASLIDAPGYETAIWVFISNDCERLVGAFDPGGVYVAPQR